MKHDMKKYLYEEADDLHNFVRKMGYLNELSNTALHIYFGGMCELEKLKTGLSQSTSASYDEIAKYSLISKPSVKKALNELNNVLCEIYIGESFFTGKKATRFRRYSIPELKSGNPYRRLVNDRPESALELKCLLTERSFRYDGLMIKPNWSISRTGRLYSITPNIQGDPPKDRAAKLSSELKSGQILFYIDYKHAEPSVIRHAIDFEITEDVYELFSKVFNIDRNDAKSKVGILHYSSTEPLRTLHSCFDNNVPDEIKLYANALEQFRNKLWNDGRPQSKGQRRYVNTLYGNMIKSNRGEGPHKGKILNWYAQGTVADIINSVSLQLIKKEKSYGWRFLFPVHDAIYIIGKPEDEVSLKNIFLSVPRRYGLMMDVSIEKF